MLHAISYSSQIVKQESIAAGVLPQSWHETDQYEYLLRGPASTYLMELKTAYACFYLVSQAFGA
jgi:hypothetical protein